MFVGVRALIHDMDDRDWIVRPGPDAGLAMLEAQGVPFDYVTANGLALRPCADDLRAAPRPPVGDRSPGQAAGRRIGRAIAVLAAAARASGGVSARIRKNLRAVSGGTRLERLDSGRLAPDRRRGLGYLRAGAAHARQRLARLGSGRRVSAGMARVDRDRGGARPCGARRHPWRHRRNLLRSGS